MSSFLKSLDDEAAYLDAGLERTQAELERNQAELERIQKRLAANREERRRVATQSHNSRPASIAAIIAAPTAATTAAPPEKKRKQYKPTPQYPDYNFFLSVDGDVLRADEMLGGHFVATMLKSRFNNEVAKRPEKYHEALFNPERHVHPRKCLNDESPTQDQDVACRWCTEHKIPCMRLAWDKNSGLGLCAAPLAPSLREGYKWNEMGYWMFF